MGYPKLNEKEEQKKKHAMLSTYFQKGRFHSHVNYAMMFPAAQPVRRRVGHQGSLFYTPRTSQHDEEVQFRKGGDSAVVSDLTPAS